MSTHVDHELRPALAASALQAWLARTLYLSNATKKLVALAPHSHVVRVLLDQFRASDNLEESQHLILDEKFLTYIGMVLLALPPSSSLNPKQISTLRRKVSSAVLIAKYPIEVLGDADSSPDMLLSIKQCQYASTLVVRYLEKVTNAIASGRSSGWRGILQPFVWCLEYYLKSFDDWKTADGVRMIRSVEEAFSLSYRALLAARVAVHQGEAGSEAMMRSAELQVRKFGELMLRMLGKAKGSARVEELSAALEAGDAAYQAATRSPAPAGPLTTTASSLPPPPPSLPSSLLPTEGPPPQPSATAEEEARMVKFLNLLSNMAGLENERMAHEITLDGNYRLPVNPTPSTGDDSKHLPSFLRRRLLNVIGDRMVNSLRRSNVSNYDEVSVGAVVPVLLGEDCYSSKVVSVRAGELEVEFVTDGQHVLVPLTAVKLTSQPLSGRVLLSALDDLCRSIAQLTPSRFEAAYVSLRQSYDAEMLEHWVEHDALSPAQELLPIFVKLQQQIIALQAEYRVQGAEQWLATFQDAFFADRPMGVELLDAATRKIVALAPAAPLPVRRREQTERPLEEVLPLVLEFFEHSVELVEEIQRDMANYYISMLVPVMQRHGAQFLAQRFQKRLAAQQVSLETTASALLAVVQPAETWQATVADWVDTDLLPPAAALASLPQLLVAESEDAVVRAAVGSMLVRLLRSPFRIDSPQGRQALPATLAFDAQRLAKVRDVVDRICLECTLVIALRQVLQHFRIAPREQEEIELQHRLDALLSTDTSVGGGGDGDGVNRKSISLELQHYVEFAVYRSQQAAVSRGSGGGSAMATSSFSGSVLLACDPKDLEQRIEYALTDALTENNMVLQLFQKRVCKVLLRAMLGKPYAHKLVAYSLQSQAQERNLTTAVAVAKQVFDLGAKVHLPIYTHILRAVAAQGLA